MEKIENILTDCIKEIKSGKATLSQCLDRYPSRRRELEPLLKLALNITEQPALKMDTNLKQATKVRLMQQMQASRQRKAKTFSEIFSFGLPQRYAWARVPVSVLIVLILLSSLTGGTVYASQSSLPGDLLYPVKTTTEEVRVLLAGSLSAKAELNLRFAQIRLEEMSELSNTSGENTILAVNGYRRNLQDVLQQIIQITNDSLLIKSLEEALAFIQNQVAFCDQIIDTNPSFIDGVEEADSLAINSQAELIGNLARQNGLLAAQINFNAMQNRLQRAGQKAGTNQYQLMAKVLSQYQLFNQLGEKILQNAPEGAAQTLQIEELSLQVLPSYLDILDSIYQQVPQQYQNNVQLCQQSTQQFQMQVRHRYQRQGNPEAGPESLNQENDDNAAQQVDQSVTQSNGGGFTASGASDSTRDPSAGPGGIEAGYSGNTNGNNGMGDGGQGSGGTGGGSFGQ